MTRVRAAVAVLVTMWAVSACAISVGGQAVPGPAPSTASAGTPNLPKVGQCMNSNALTAIDCAQIHEAEVMAIGDISSLPNEYPDTTAFRKAVLPACQSVLSEYLGSDDAEATRLRVWAFWPNQQGWKEGQRWRLCTVMELTPDEKPVARKGSVKDILKGDAFATFQTCSADQPSKPVEIKAIACGAAHRAETVPGGVVPLGKFSDPAPSTAQMNSVAEEKCTKAVHAYIGTDKRPDVIPAWRTPGSQAWSEGWTYAICYAEANRVFSGTLWGLGDKPLPN